MYNFREASDVLKRSSACVCFTLLTVSITLLHTEAVKLENKHFVYRSTSADAQHSLTVDLNIEQSPTFTIRNADGSTAYQY